MKKLMILHHKSNTIHQSDIQETHTIIAYVDNTPTHKLHRIGYLKNATTFAWISLNNSTTFANGRFDSLKEALNNAPFSSEIYVFDNINDFLQNH